MVFANDALTAGSPPSSDKRDMIAEDRVAPLAERNEIVEALEHDVLLGEVRAVSGVLQPIPSYGLFRVFGFAALDIGEPIVDPRFKEVEALTHLHVVIVGDRQQRVPVGEDRVERFADLAHLGGMASPVTPRCRSQ